jgi:hypothetical protein
MAWDIEFTPEFEAWWQDLTSAEQIEIDAKVRLLEEFGPVLPRPHSDVIVASKHSNMKELRASTRTRILRVLYAFDPRRTAILLIGGDKAGRPDWYREFVPVADKLFDEHLAQLKRRRK